MLVYIVVQLATMYVSTRIKINKFKKTYTSYGDKGYKIDQQKISDYEYKNSKLNQAIDLVCFLIPGVNIVNTIIRTNKSTNEFKKNVDESNALIPMNDNEIKYYNSLNNINKKILFIVQDNNLENQDLLSEYIKLCLADEDKVLDKKVAQLYYDKLPPISYTINEVKQLSKAIDSSYKLGKVEGVNTAIIGLPDDCEVEKVILKRQDKLETYYYEQIDDERLNDEHFIIYPFGIDYEESDELKDCYKKITDKRDEVRKNSMILNEYHNDTKPYVKVKKSR